MVKDSYLGVRIPIDVREAAQAAAQVERRSVSSLVVKVLADWLAAAGYLAVDPENPSRD
jgi:predicted HicB family RNase H-like nuclease